MIVAFALVAFQSFKNRIVSQLRRLKQPRYLLGAIGSILYFYFVIFHRNARHRGGVRTIDIIAQQGFGELRIDFVSLVVVVLALVAWALPMDSGGLEFTQAEIAFLFPAPLSRRQLLLYKFVRTQAQVLFTAIVVSIFAVKSGFFLGVWAAFSVASMYTMMVSLGRARLRMAGINFIVRLVAVAAALSAIAWYGFQVAQRLTSTHQLPRGRQALAAIHVVFHEPLPAVLLYIPRFVVTAMYPTSAFVLLQSFAVLAILGTLFFHIASRFNIAFEEASIDASKKQLERRALRSGRRTGKHVMFRRMRAPFLAPTGLPDYAIVWKNVVAMLRVSAGWAIAMLAVIFAGFTICWIVRQPVSYLTMGCIFAMQAALFPLIGPTTFANDLRLDLSRFEVLKSYPISGERLVAAEIAASLVVISFFEMLFLVSAAVLIALGGSETPPALSIIASPQFIIVALLVTIPLCAVQLVLRNSVPIFFPAWAGRSKEDPRGIAFTGQRIIMLIANVLALSLALLPAAIVLVPSLWAAMTWFKGHPISIAIATLPAVATLVAEVIVAIHFLGMQFDRLDVSNEIEIVEFA